MGTDIGGWVEISYEDDSHLKSFDETWIEVLYIAPVMDRNYYMFASLFDVRNNSTLFRPIAPRRGLPPLASPASQEMAKVSSDVTWIGWDEIQRIDWNEQSLRPVTVTRFPEYPERKFVGGHVFGIQTEEYITRGDALHGTEEQDWVFLFSMMEQIYTKSKPYGIRLVVGFV